MSLTRKSRALKLANTTALRIFDKIAHPKEVQIITGIAKDYGVEASDLYDEVRTFIIMNEQEEA